MIKCFIFDLDGTLVDSVPDLTLSVNYALRINGFKERTEEQILSYIGNGSNVLIRKAIGCDIDDVLFKTVFDDYMSYYLAHVCVNSKLYDGISEVINYLRKNNILVCCLTNKPEDAAVELLNKLLPSKFDCIVGNSKNVPPKPDPFGLKLIMNKFNLKPDNICYLGDSDVDMILARNAGIVNKIACNYGYRSRAELEKERPLYLINSPREIFDLKSLFSAK